MDIYCIYTLFLLLMIHLTYTFTLHSFLYSTKNKFLDYQNNSQSQERLRRWSKFEDHDEIEIPLNETLLINNSNDLTTINSILNSTLLNFEIIELNSSIIENINNSTIKISLDNENYPLVELNQTITSILQENITDINEINFSSTIFNDLIQSNEFQISSPSISQTTDHIELITLIENDSDLLLNNSFIQTTNNQSNIIQKDAIIITEEIYSNDTEIILLEPNQNINETLIISSNSISIPICDHACQCLKECPYGFEILNDTCLCNPPCKNYQCFGNDTCIVTDKGQPLCQSENGIEHVRPTRCYQPRDAGYHDINTRYYNRWYYNPDQDTCHLFVYRGLGGNENNFQTLHQCHLECITCAPLPDPGECLGHINMWYFNRNENQCKQFQYSGCKGNENKFVKKEQCIDTCINRIFNL